MVVSPYGHMEKGTVASGISPPADGTKSENNSSDSVTSGAELAALAHPASVRLAAMSATPTTRRDRPRAARLRSSSDFALDIDLLVSGMQPRRGEKIVGRGCCGEQGVSECSVLSATITKSPTALGATVNTAATHNRRPKWWRKEIGIGVTGRQSAASSSLRPYGRPKSGCGVEKKSR